MNNLFLGSALATLVGKLLHCCARSPTKENISETLHGPLHGADSYGTKRKTLYGKTRREVNEKLTRATANRARQSTQIIERVGPCTLVLPGNYHAPPLVLS